MGLAIPTCACEFKDPLSECQIVNDTNIKYFRSKMSQKKM